jgi:hypothetical protein
LIAIPVESLFIVDYLRAGSKVDISVLISLLVSDYEFREWGLPVTPSDFKECATAKDLIDRIHELYLGMKQKPQWGQKTPRFIRHGHLLKSLYPHARFIHVIRDPRAVAISLIKSNLHRSNVLYAARRWRKDVGFGLELKSAYPNDVYEVRYEDLVSQPAETLHAVCAFLQIPYDECMLGYYRTGTADYSRFFDQLHATLNEPPRRDRIEAWRLSLSRQQLAVVEAICGDRMKQFGYDFLLSEPSIAPAYGFYCRVQRLGGISLQIMHRVLFRFRPLFSFIWRKLRLGLLWQDMAELNY